MADIKFQLKTGYLVLYNSEEEDDYEIKKISYFNLYRKPTLTTFFQSKVSYFKSPTDINNSKTPWQLVSTSKIFTSKKSAKDHKAKKIEQEWREETKSKVDNLQSQLDEIKKTL